MPPTPPPEGSNQGFDPKREFYIRVDKVDPETVEVWRNLQKSEEFDSSWKKEVNVDWADMEIIKEKKPKIWLTFTSGFFLGWGFSLAMNGGALQFDMNPNWLEDRFLTAIFFGLSAILWKHNP